MPETRIHLLAPSGYPHDRMAMTRGVERLQEAGCRVSGLAVLDRSEQRYAGSDAERAADINALATLDQLPDIALAIRGGYGATRLLSQLHYDALRERLGGSHTLLIGHSDFTALQLALHAMSSLCTFSGPMLGADFGAHTLSEFTWRHFWDTVRSPSTQVEWNTAPGAELDVEGPLWGGNLAVLCSLVGTPYFPAIDGGILFVEDVGEPPFRIERMLYQLQLSGVLGRQRALLLGDFSKCRPSSYDNGYGLADSFEQIRRASGIPVIDGLPIGHEPDKFTLPFGVPARLRVDGGKARLGFSGYPHLSP
jgi:muramoyltetrapeptide carboxypeptidase